MWLELRDKSIRTEEDVIALLEMPMLVSMPWIAAETAKKKGEDLGESEGEEKKETVEV
jgi:hypothetical protein